MRHNLHKSSLSVTSQPAIINVLEVRAFWRYGFPKSCKKISFFAKHKSKKRHFCKRVLQEGLICLATFRVW
jgi:hypothetical protein